MCLHRKGATTFFAVMFAGLLTAGPVLSSAYAEEIRVPEAGASPTIDKIRKAGELRAGIAISAPRLIQDPKSGNYGGIAIQIGDRVAKTLGVPLRIVPSNWDTFIAGLQAGQYDISLAPAYATPQRLSVVDFVTYTVAGVCYATLKTNTKVNTLAELDEPGVRIGTLTGTGGEQGVKAKYKKATIDSVVGAPGIITRIPDVLAGRIDVTTFDSPLARAIEETYPQLRIIPEGADGCVRQPDFSFPSGLSVRKGDPAYHAFVAAIVKAMKDSGEIDEQIARYSTTQYMILK